MADDENLSAEQADKLAHFQVNLYHPTSNIKPLSV